MCFRPKPRKVLVTGTRMSTPGSHDLQNGVPLMPNITPVASSEAARYSSAVAANTKQSCGVISVDGDENYHLPR